MKYNWNIHQICDKGELTYHTHGLSKYGSLELELNLSLVPKQAALFVNLIAESIANGTLYESGQRVTEIFNAPFYLFKTHPIHGTFTKEGVLRIIIPDENFLFPWEHGCNPIYRGQLSEVEIRKMALLLQPKNEKEEKNHE